MARKLLLERPPSPKLKTLLAFLLLAISSSLVRGQGRQGATEAGAQKREGGEEGSCSYQEGGSCAAKYEVTTAEALRSTSLLWPTAIYSGSLLEPLLGHKSLEGGGGEGGVSNGGQRPEASSTLLRADLLGRGAEAIEAARRRVLSSARQTHASQCSHKGLHHSGDGLFAPDLGTDILEGAHPLPSSCCTLEPSNDSTPPLLPLQG